MEVTIKHYKELDINEFHDLISLRIAVFVIEQNCPYQELDGLDKDAYHLIVTERDEIIGTLRILKPGASYENEYGIGRVVSHEDHRGKRMGHLMMERTMLFFHNSLKTDKIRLSGQSHLTSFYEKYGFASTGKEYLEDGIPHTDMLFNSESL
ncbi:MAG: ElaA protein [Arenicella sp.]|jgi:ElaA protein